MTTIAQIKSALHQQVANTEDEKILHKMKQYFQSLTTSEKRIIAYNSQGRPLTSQLYIAEVQKSRVQHKRGKVVSQKEMEKGL